jgi:hypothetical protein
MTRPTNGCCGTCGYLSRRVTITQAGTPRDYRNYNEVELHERDEPRGDLHFVPHGTNSKVLGEFACYRLHADLAKEIRDDSAGDILKASEAVVWRDRHCNLWSKYEPGVEPRDQLEEMKARDYESSRRKFETTLAEFGGRLTKAAIWFALIIGVAQIAVTLLTMTSESIAYPSLHAAYCSLRRMIHSLLE